MDTNEFLRGQQDCKVGVEHKPNQHPDYDRGYGAEYEAEQLLTEMGLRQANER